MHIEKTSIEGLLILTPDVFTDARGYFLESYQKDAYAEAGIVLDFVQDNLSFSTKGVIRGLHYQIHPFEQGKLMQVLAGRALDVAVDIRAGSLTFGHHVAVELSSKNHKQLWIPPGFAHGFAVLEEGTVLSYKCTGVYSKEHERGIRFDDPTLKIEWGVEHPIVSEKDQTLPLFERARKDFIS